MIELLSDLLSGPNVLLVGAAMFLVAGAVTYFTVQAPDAVEVQPGMLGIHDAIFRSCRPASAW